MRASSSTSLPLDPGGAAAPSALPVKECLAGADQWMAGGLSRADVLAYFSESTENISNVTPLIADGIQYTPYLV